MRMFWITHETNEEKEMISKRNKKKFLQYPDNVKTYQHFYFWVTQQTDCHMLCGLKHPVIFTYCWQLSSKSVSWLCFLEGRAVAKPRVIYCSCIIYSYQRQDHFASTANPV